MRTRHKFLICTGAALAFLMGYGAMTMAYPAAGVYGRGEYKGYFSNTYDDDGTYVLAQNYSGEAIRPTVEGNVNDFISFIKNTKLDLDGNGTTTQDRTGAQFIIQTMLGGRSHTKPAVSASDPYLVQWEKDVRYAASKNWIVWRTRQSWVLNSYYQGAHTGTNPADDAFYDDSDSGDVILFKNSSGAVVYMLKWACANPVSKSGSPPGLEDPNEFDITAQTLLDNASPFPGQTIKFTYDIRNIGPDTTSPATINWIAQDRPSNATIASGNKGVMAPSATFTTVYTENYTVPLATAAGTKICRGTAFNPLNEVGGASSTADVCATVRANYDLTPYVTFQILDSGGAVKSTTDPVAELGDSIVFKYRVNNSTSSASPAVGCKIYTNNYSGYHATPAPPGYDTSAAVGDCSRIFPSGDTNLPDESVSTAGWLNRTVCRSLEVNPASPLTGAEGDEQCILIASKPYMRVYGGDISAGNGQPTACTPYAGAAVVGWNKEGGGGFAGQGSQFAIFALSKIYDSATVLGPSGGALIPSGLAFSNIGASGGMFGGNFGSLPCIPDYYAAKPGSAGALGTTNIGALNTGAYTLTGTTTLSGAVGAGKRISIFVQGDVLLNGNITYPANWTSGTTPLLHLVVKGNIYVSQSVTQLDGVYIAQQNGASGGTIYTCANTALPVAQVAPTAATFYTTCHNKLTINGIFAARQVQFLRTNGTLSQATATETAASGNGAEVFNYNPALWMAAPPGQATTSEYDAITSLSPIL